LELKDYIRDIPNFPKEGIIFKDITPLLKDKEAFRYTIEEMSKYIKDDIRYIIGPESRGFIFGPAVAFNVNKGFIPIRKKGKLPYKTISKTYSLEYGEATLEMHIDAIEKGDKVVIIDDVLATGGTMKAIIEMIESQGAIVDKVIVLIELLFLNPRELLKGYDIVSLIQY